MDDKLRDALIAEANHAQATALDVARSGAYLYPFKGIIHLYTTPHLQTPLLSRTHKTLTLGLTVTSTMFFFTYLPQATIMAFTSGPLAPISAALLVLTESSTITTYLARSFLLHDALIDTFDATLITQGEEKLVASGREIKPSSSSSRGADAVERLGKLVSQPWGGLDFNELVKAAILLPLNLVPVVGTALYVYVQGKKGGPGAHERYFQLKGWGRKEREEWVRRNRGGYTGLGIASYVLEMIPFASLGFSFSNTVGAALWAADLEKAMK